MNAENILNAFCDIHKDNTALCDEYTVGTVQYVCNQMYGDGEIEKEYVRINGIKRVMYKLAVA